MANKVIVSININTRVSCSSNCITCLVYLTMHFLNCYTVDYFLSRLPVVEKRLSQAGVRLAATLNQIFSSTPSISQD